MCIVCFLEVLEYVPMARRGCYTGLYVNIVDGTFFIRLGIRKEFYDIGMASAMLICCHLGQPPPRTA
jgi:hypothetical protein